MNDIYKAVIRTKTSYLVHYNHNHDKLGRFAKSNGSGVSKRNIPFVSNYIHEIKDLKEKGVVGKYVSEMKDLKEKGIVGKYKSDVKKIIYGPEKSSETKKTSGIDHDELITSLEKINDEGKKYPDKDLQEQAKIAGDIAKDEKNFIPDKDISKFTKNHQLKSFKGKVGIDHGYDFRTDKEDYNVVGYSSTRTWKEEVKSKGGVHIVQSHPTTIDFGDVGSDGGGGLDRKKLKTLDSFSRSKETNKAIYEGRDVVASTRSKTNKQDWSPRYISYGFKDGKPVIKNVEYYYKYADDFEDYVIVDFYENRKPRSAHAEYGVK